MAVNFIGVPHAATIRTKDGHYFEGGGLDDEKAKLCQAGLRSAQKIGNRLADLCSDDLILNNVAFAYAPVGRCKDTAKLISMAFQRKCHELIGEWTDYPMYEVPDLKPLDYRKLEGEKNSGQLVKCLDWFNLQSGRSLLTHKFLEPEWKWKSNPFTQFSPEEAPETIMEVYERGVSAFEEIGKKFLGKTVVVVSDDVLLWSVAEKFKSKQSALPVYYEAKGFTLLPDRDTVLFFERDPYGKISFLKKENINRRSFRSGKAFAAQ